MHLRIEAVSMLRADLLLRRRGSLLHLLLLRGGRLGHDLSLKGGLLNHEDWLLHSLLLRLLRH